MSNPKTAASGSFRLPNSLVQGLTTCTAADLNRLSAFPMMVLIGLLAQVSPKQPAKEVETTVSEILKIIEVSHNVAHAVSREWVTTSGQTHRAKYQGRRCSPSHIERIHKALLILHQQTVVVRGRDRRKRTRTGRVVHILDSFGYVYRQNGEVLDLDDLPEGAEKINISSDERPVYRRMALTSS